MLIHKTNGPPTPPHPHPPCYYYRVLRQNHWTAIATLAMFFKNKYQTLSWRWFRFYFNIVMAWSRVISFQFQYRYVMGDFHDILPKFPTLPNTEPTARQARHIKMHQWSRSRGGSICLKYQWDLHMWSLYDLAVCDGSIFAYILLSVVTLIAIILYFPAIWAPELKVGP